jgi:biotin transport system substrate-specific component
MRASMPSPSLLVQPRMAALRPIAVTVGLVAMIIASAYISIPPPIGPVPMTMQSLAVLMAALWAGPRLGSAACVAYLGLGLVGLPVLAGGAAVPGLALFTRPSAGFLLAFPVAALVAGWVFRARRARTVGALVALSAGHAVIFIGGVVYLARFMPFDQAVVVGFVPFIASSLLKIGLGTALIAATTAVLSERAR